MQHVMENAAQSYLVQQGSDLADKVRTLTPKQAVTLKAAIEAAVAVDVAEKAAVEAAPGGDAGAIVLGKGNTNEFAFGIDGRNSHWGDCHNPFDTSRISGGSSSGPAAAVGSGRRVLARSEA